MPLKLPVKGAPSAVCVKRVPVAMVRQTVRTRHRAGEARHHGRGNQAVPSCSLTLRHEHLSFFSSSATFTS